MGRSAARPGTFGFVFSVPTVWRLTKASTFPIFYKASQRTMLAIRSCLQVRSQPKAVARDGPKQLQARAGGPWSSNLPSWSVKSFLETGSRGTCEVAIPATMKSSIAAPEWLFPSKKSPVEVRVSQQCAWTMRLVFLSLLLSLGLGFQLTSVEAQTSVEQPPMDVPPSIGGPMLGEMPPVAGQPTAGHKIPTEREKLEEFCGKEANQQHEACVTLKAE